LLSNNFYQLNTPTNFIVSIKIGKKLTYDIGQVIIGFTS